MNLHAWLRGPAALASGLLLLAPAAAQTPAPAAAAALPPFAAADWKPIDPQNLLVIDTSKGRVVVEMRPEFSAEHVERIKTLAREGYYDGLQFFRVIDVFMAQGGDKANNGAGETGLPPLTGAFSFRRGPDGPFVGASNGRGGTFGFVGPSPVNSQPDDLMALTADGKVKAWGVFCPGVAGMARTNNPDSASSQFFLMRQAFQTLDDQYTPWGRVVQGLDVVRAFNVGEPPANPDVMTKVRVAADLPAAERPNLWRVDPASPAFRARMAAAVQAKGPAFTPCDVEVPVEARR
jgi:peptidylprolyl isomerase